MNDDIFPNQFIFQMYDKEYKSLMPQFAISKKEAEEDGKFSEICSRLCRHFYKQKSL